MVAETQINIWQDAEWQDAEWKVTIEEQGVDGCDDYSSHPITCANRQAAIGKARQLRQHNNWPIVELCAGIETVID